EKSQPEWVKDARMKPVLQSTGEELIALLPDDPEGLLNRLKNPKAATEEAVPDSDTPAAAPPPAPPAAPPAAAPAASPPDKT
ncbi:MAG TPA: CvpA family protein, partial [Methylovirgula sp.]|nr:CvpA family protein [Methylovirgula sp.]